MKIFKFSNFNFADVSWLLRRNRRRSFNFDDNDNSYDNSSQTANRDFDNDRNIKGIFIVNSRILFDLNLLASAFISQCEIGLAIDASEGLVLALDTMRNTTIQASVIDENQVR
jgi:hypothetical protein